ncbi:MAG: hypothetical protein MI863_11855 [Desulfobacterales bacterium]|nr:hypothetical protein [Desulfobacterales bacterium]
MDAINPKAQKALMMMGAIQHLKKNGLLNPVTAKMALSDPELIIQKLEHVNSVSEMFKGAFEHPDKSVDELIKCMITENSIPVGFNPVDCHVLIAGQTGCGKSTLLKLMFSQILKLESCGAPFKTWLFVKAQDMRPLLQMNPNIVVTSLKGIKINPLEPPLGITPKNWAMIFVDVWIQAFRLYDASKAFLIECISELYQVFAKHNHFPSLFDLYGYVKGLKFSGFSRTARYQESVLNRLSGMLYGSLGEVFDCSRGHTNLFIHRNVIFELLYLPIEQQVFLTNYLLSYLFNSKLTKETPVRHFVGIDDANQIFDASYEKRPDLGLPIIHHLLTTVRKAKINVFALTQTPHQVGASIHSNAFAKIMFSLSNGKDIELMQQSMGIMDPQQKDYCYCVPPREAIVKFSARYQHPFIARVPEFNTDGVSINDRVLAINNDRLFSGFKIQARFQPECEIEVKQEPEDHIVNEPPNLPEMKAVDPNTHDFLMAVNLNQYKKPITEIYKLANLTAGTGSRLAKSCEKDNLIKVIRIAFGRGRPRYPVLLPKAYSILGIKEKKFYGKGAGQEHVLYQHLIQQHFSDFEPVIELNREGKFMDVGVETDKQLIAIEVAMTAANEKQNIEKDITKAKADRVIVACKDKKVLGAVEKILSGMEFEFVNKTRACLIGDLLKRDPERVLKDWG